MTRTPSPDALWRGQPGLPTRVPATNTRHGRTLLFGSRPVRVIGQVIGLLAGRSAYRAAVSVSSLVLLESWGAHEFGRYWTLVGGFQVLVPITSWGIEKAALNLIPQTGPALQPIFVRLSLGLCVLSLSAIGLLVMVLPLADSGLFALLGVTAALQGANQALAGLARAVGRPVLDMVNFGVLAAALLALTAGVGLTGWTAEVFGGGQLVLVLLLNTVLLCAVAPPRSWRTPVPRPAADDPGRNPGTLASWRRPAVTAGVMGFHTVIGTLPLSLCFALLGALGMQEEAAKFGIAHAVISTLLAFFQYVLRLGQPALVVLLRDTRAGRVVAWMHRGTAAVAIGMLPYGCGIMIAAALADAAGSLHLQAAFLALLALPILCITEFVNYFHENHAAAFLPRVSLCILAGCAAAVVMMVTLVPYYGSTGAMVAIVIGEEVNLLAIYLLMRRPIPAAPRYS